MSLVYVVDDNPAHAMLFTKRIEKALQVEVRTFTEPFKALVAALEDPPDVLVVDFMMPAMDGIQLVREIRKVLGANPPVIFVTGAPMEVSNRAIPDNHVVGVIEKPPDFGRMIELVSAALQEEAVS